MKHYRLRSNTENMGAFFTNLHLRDISSEAVCSALPALAIGRAYVSPQTNRWVTVYLECTEDQNDKTLRSIATALSRQLKTDAIAFLVHDSDIAAYWLFQNGGEIDEFNSAPDYFGNRVSDEERRRVRGSSDLLLPLCMAGTTREQLEMILHPADGHPTFAEEIVTDLCELLGIDDTRASLGFKYFEDEGEEILSDIAEFVPVGKGAEQKQARRPAPRAGAASGALLDTYSIAINMLTQMWSNKHEKDLAGFCDMFGKDTEPMLKKMREGFDKSARGFLKKSEVQNRPDFEELKAARDRGPEALAALIAERTPERLAEVGFGAALNGLEAFLAALLKHGLDPNAPTPQGRTTLSAAEQFGRDSGVYRLAKAAAER